MVRRWAAATIGAIAFLLYFPMSVLAQEDNEIAEVDDRLERGVNLENWEMITAFLLPFIMPVILQSTWSSRAKAVATFIVAFIVAFVGEILQVGFQVDDWFGSGMKIFILAIPVYYGLAKPTGIAPAIERKTDL